MDIKKIIENSVMKTLQDSGKMPKVSIPEKNIKQKLVAENKVEKKQSTVLKEAHHAIPQSFVLRTEKLSEGTKGAHERLYQDYVDKFNKASSDLDASNKQEANANFSKYRSSKNDETYNFNALKLHELYFSNISDLASEISVDAIPYMRLSRDFGNFQNWQFDFMAACKSAREGWAIVVYEPYRNVYMNVVVDSHNINIPLGAIPVLVMDMWAHSYYRDYEDEKIDYIVSMMREINWDVVEARMLLAERSDLSGLYMIKPLYNAAPGQILNAAKTEPPITDIPVTGQIQTAKMPEMQSDSSVPPNPTNGMVGRIRGL